jgi:hypothetical protein
VNAQTYTPNTTNGLQYAFANTTTPSGQTYLMSFYVKANGYTNCRIENALNSLGVWFNLSNGTITSGTGGTITALSNGWYLVSLLLTSLGSATQPLVSFAPSTSLTFAGDGVSGGYVFGAQLVEGTTPQTYLPTTDRLNVPRLDYSNGSSPSLLLEPQRTNLFLWSGQLSDTSWAKFNCTITANSSTAPDGTQTASLVDDGIAASTQHWFYQIPTFAYNTTYTISFYAKYVSRKYMSVNIYNGVTSQYVDYDIQNGTVFGATGDVTASIISVGNGWYRVAYTRTIAASGSPNLRITLADDTGNETYTGSNKQVLIWGAQFEVGAYPSSYIGTTTASATRLVDTFTRNNIYTNNLISVSGGTWFTQFNNNISYTRDVGNSNLFIGDTNTAFPTNSLEIRNPGTFAPLQIGKRISGTSYTGLYQTTTNPVKIILKWNGTSVDVFVNGVKVVTASSFTITNMEFLYCQIQDVPRFLQQTALFPTPLSDAECIRLTADYTDGTSITNIYEQYVNNLGGTVENLNGVTNLIQNLR